MTTIESHRAIAGHSAADFRSSTSEFRFPPTSAHPPYQRHRRHDPSEPGDDIVERGRDGVFANGWSLCDRHRHERPHDDEQKKGNGADELAQPEGH
jgi:hypothetical protein